MAVAARQDRGGQRVGGVPGGRAAVAVDQDEVARPTSGVRALLAELAVEQENQLKLGVTTDAFREAVSQPGMAEAFDRDFGGLPQSARTAHRAA